MRTSNRPLNQRSLWSRKWPVFVVAGLLLLFFWPYLLLDQTLFAGDTAFVFLPFREFVTERLLNGQVPLWNPYSMGGTPALAEGTHQVFYWPNFILALLGVARGMGWTLPLHLALMAAGMFYFARYSLNLNRPAALCVAIVFCFGGGTQSRLAISVYTQAAAWMPWIFLFYDYARKRGGAALLLPGLPLAMQLLTGGLPFTYYTLCLLAAYHLYQIWNDRAARQSHFKEIKHHTGSAKLSWAALGATFCVGVCLAAAQIIPQYELARLSDRSTRASYDYVTLFSLTPQHFALTALFPKFYGLFNTAALDNFTPGEETGYLGVITIGLIAAAFAMPQRRQVLFWFGILVVTVFIALGKYNPVYHFLYEYVPGFAMFRAPARWMLLTSFAGAVLAGIGMQAILNAQFSKSRALFYGFIVLFLAALASIGILLSPIGRPALQIEQSPFGPWGQAALWTVAAIIFGGFWLLNRKPPITLNLDTASQEQPAVPDAGLPFKRQQYCYALLIGLLTFDFFALAQDMEWQHVLPVSTVEQPSPTAKFLQSRSVQERFWTPKPQIPMERWQTPTAFGANTPSEHRAVAATVAQALMPSCVPSQYETLGLTGAWGSLMPTRRHPKPIYEKDTPPEISQRWLRLLNVRYYLSLQPMENSSLQLLTQEPIYIYQDTQALPRLFVVNTAQVVSTDQAMQFVGSENFNPRREVLLEGGTINSAQKPLSTEEPQARLISSTPHLLRIESKTPQNGYLVVMDSVYPGWRATVDNKQVEIQPGNWVGRALPVSSGTSQIQMWYEPQTYRIGLFITLLTLSVFGFFAAPLFSCLRRK